MGLYPSGVPRKLNQPQFNLTLGNTNLSKFPPSAVDRTVCGGSLYGQVTGDISTHLGWLSTHVLILSVLLCISRGSFHNVFYTL